MIAVTADRPRLPTALTETRVVAIVRGLAPGRVDDAVDALLDAGIVVVEITLDSPAALDGIRRLAARGGPLVLGAGTVLSVEQAAQAVEAGATFLVSPHTDTEIVAWAARRGVPALPGALTPTEIVSAWNAGAAAVKVFPSGPFGAPYLKALAEPLAHVPLIPTGGVTADNAQALLDAGAVAVGAGGWLLGDGDPGHVRQRGRALRAAVA